MPCHTAPLHCILLRDILLKLTPTYTHTFVDTHVHTSTSTHTRTHTTISQDRFQGDQLMANHEQLKEFSMNSQRFVLAWVRKNFMQS